jgi:hypothetical protein
MVLDIQTVHHILKNTAVQNVIKPSGFHYGLDFHFNYNERYITNLQIQIANQMAPKNPSTTS